MKRKNWKKYIAFSLLFLSLIPLIWEGILLGSAVYMKRHSESQYASNEFAYSDTYDSYLDGGYSRKVPVKSMAKKLERLHVEAVPLVGVSGELPSPEMILPVTLTYYEEPDTESTIAVEIPKGTEVLYFLNREWPMLVYGYGARSLPGYEPGWRCVRPFVKTQETVSGETEAIDKLEYAYIRLEQLEAVVWEYRRQEPLWRRSENPLFIEGYVFEELRTVDMEFYQKGIYNSPDLAYPIWDTWDTVLLGVSIVLFLAGSILLLLEREERNER